MCEDHIVWKNIGRIIIYMNVCLIEDHNNKENNFQNSESELIYRVSSIIG